MHCEQTIAFIRICGVPDSLRFVLIVACLGGVGYGEIWALANYPPEKTEIVKPVPNVKFDN